MRRREVIVLVGAAALAARAAFAQQAEQIRRIGWLGVGSPAAPSNAFGIFRAGLGDLGYVEGHTFVFEQRWWDGRNPDDVPQLADALVRANVDVLVVQGPATYGARYVTRIPIIFGFSGDPVAAGLVRSLARPGGNMTGFTYMSVELNGKRLDLVREAFPAVRRIAILSNPQHPGEPLEIEETRASAAKLGVDLHYLPIRTAPERDAALAAIREARDDAIVVIPDAVMTLHSTAIAEFAARERIPVVGGWSTYARRGFVMTYGPNLDRSWRLFAPLVDKILKGAKPGDLPVQRPTEFELVINVKTAKALGLTIPPALLARADEVIE